MGLNPIALAVPVFLLSIAGELWWARRRGRALHRLNDGVTDLACGMTQQLSLVFLTAVWLAGYALVWNHRLVTLSTGAAWVVALVGVDFLYYWWHRASHEVNFFWAAHVVHHQSEDYNLAVALRQSVLTRFTELPFFWPLALVGVPPLTMATSVALSELYQFFIHTQLVGPSRGFVGTIFNLPSHHRVHHAINPGYLDKNYGAVLIVWDRLFGSFVDETEPPVYGITKPLASFNPLWAQFHYWFELAEVSRAAPRWRDKLQVWWRSPAWSPAGMPKPPIGPVSPESFQKYNPPSPARASLLYAVAQFVVALAITFGLMMWPTALPRAQAAALAALALFGLITVGALFDGRRWAWPAELARLACGAAAVAWILV